jgi:hypothetical protein
MQVPKWLIAVTVLVLAGLVWHCMGRPMPGAGGQTAAGKAAA